MLKNNKTNLLIDKKVKAITSSRLKNAKLGCQISVLNLKFFPYKKWVKSFFSDYRQIHKHILRKKLIELYTTYVLLDIRKDNEYLDAAGGRFTYADKIDCQRSFLQDIRVPKDMITTIGNKVKLISSSAARIPLNSQSIDSISCHHSFDHFQGDTDILFIKEVQRLLKRGGEMCNYSYFNRR